MVERLIQLLTAQKDEYSWILQLAESKKAALGQEDLASLEQISQNEAAILQKIEQLEEKRLALTADLAKNLGLSQEQTFLSAIIARTQQPQKDHLLFLQAEFLALVQKIAFTNQVNRKLVQTQLKYTSFFLNALTGNAPTASTYDNAGSLRENQAGRHKIMDRQV